MPPMSSPKPAPQAARHRWWWVPVVLLLVAGGWWVWEQSRPTGAPTPQVSLDTQPQFQVKRNQRLMGVDIMQITDRQEPQEFLVLNNIPETMVDPVFGKPVDLEWANMLANQYLKNRDPESSEAPPSVEIQEVRTVRQGILKHEGRQLPYWQVVITFRLGHETESRHYEAGIVRHVQPDADTSKRDTVVVAYAQQGAYQQAVVPRLLDHLSFETP